MEESFPMIGGDGPYSYIKNSTQQKKAAVSANTMLSSGILESLVIQHPIKLFTIADLGCSTGPNTFIAMENVIEGVIQKYKTKGESSLPEFQVHFNDHVSNDFNILFANLPSNRKYFANGVPGSFYGRLFPRASLNFAYSAFAIHWLSKAPPELGDVDSPTCNRGRIYYANAPHEVSQAYRLQYAKDMKSFLAARAEELVSGGLMTLLISGRPEGTLPSQNSFGPLVQPLESCLIDMVNEEIIGKEEIDSFNLPFYTPATEELRAIIQENGNFRIARLERLPENPVPLPTVEQCRSGFDSILRKHFDGEIVEQVFERYATKAVGHPLITLGDGFTIGLFVLLQRKDE